MDLFLFNNTFLSDIKLKYKNNIYLCHKQILSKSLFFRMKLILIVTKTKH